MTWQKKIAIFLSAQSISLLGSSLVQYAIIWYITLTTESGLMLMFSTVCGFLPQVLISLFAGVWADRHNRKHLIMLSDGAIAVSTLILAILFLSGFKSVWLLFVVLSIRSFGTGIQVPAVSALIPQITPKAHLMKVNGIYSTISSIMMFLSPALSGAILSFASLEATFFIDVITAIIGIGMMFFLPLSKPRRHKNNCSHLEDMKEGLNYLKKHVFIKNLLIFQIILIVLISPAVFLTPLLIARSFGAEIWRLTLNEVTFGGGAVLGGILITFWSGFKNHMHTVLVACLYYAVMMVVMGFSTNFAFYLFVNLTIGIAMPFYNTPINVVVQEQVEEEMHGRVFSFMQIAVSCSLPLGMVIFGPISDIISVQSVIIGCGIAVFATTAYYFRSQKFSN